MCNTNRWLWIVLAVLVFDAVVWLCAGLVFVQEQCEGNDIFSCREDVRDLVRVLLYATPAITFAAISGWLYAAYRGAN